VVLRASGGTAGSIPVRFRHFSLPFREDGGLRSQSVPFFGRFGRNAPTAVVAAARELTSSMIAVTT